MRRKNRIEVYVDGSSWRSSQDGSNENANRLRSVGGLKAFLAESEIARYVLKHIYPPEISRAHVDGFFHIHDLGSGIVSYCAGWSLQDLLLRGFSGVRGVVQSHPPKHFSSALGQLLNCVGVVQQEWAGAQAYNTVDVLLAPFIRYDGLSYKQVKQAIQEFVHSINVPTRWGFETPFLNFSFDLKPADDLMNQGVVIGGKMQDKVYADFQEEIDMFNCAFLEVMYEGDANSSIFKFPIPTYMMTEDNFDWESEVGQWLAKATAKFGLPYFQNCSKNTGLNPHDVRAMCKLPMTEIIYKNASGEIAKSEIRRIVDDFLMRGNPIRVLVNGRFELIKDVIKLRLENEEILKVTLDNGIVDKMTLDHPSLVIRDGKLKTIESKDLHIGDEFPFAKYPYEGELGDFDLGRLVGLYVGDGWIDHNGATLNIVFNAREGELIRFTKDIAEKRFVASVTISCNERHHYCKVSIASRGLVEIIQEYVRGKGSLNKRLNSKVFARSIEFRRGLLVGMIESDGNINKERNNISIHLGNKNLIFDILILARSLGVNTTYFESKNKTGEKNKLSYTLRFSAGNPEWFIDYFRLKKGKNQKYKDYGDFYGVKIVKIERERYTGYVYDFEIDNKEHTFQLANGIITHNCCHLNLDLRELKRKTGGLFGFGDTTGSIGVVTINLARLGYLAKDEDEFFEKLRYYMDLAKESLEIKRKICNSSFEKGLMPFSKIFLKNLDNHFSTIGVVGGHECCENFLGYSIADEEGLKFMIKVLNFMRNVLVEYQEGTGNLWNLEATPAEGASYRLAKIDVRTLKNCYVSGTRRNPFYTNSTQLPVDYTQNLGKAIRHQEQLQTLYTGGTVFHTFLPERPDKRVIPFLVQRLVERTRLPYFTITPTFSVCQNCHRDFSGEQPICPVCGSVTDVWSRVVGYYSPVRVWNRGKKQEWKSRVAFSLSDYA